MENNQSAARAARRFLDDRVRSDWDYPNTPECWSASDEEVRGVVEFRERFYGDSDDESDAEAAADPYKFDSPDSIGDALGAKELRRKRQRSSALEDEMKENEGLRLWVQRRDAWTGATAVKKYGARRPHKVAPTTHGESSSTTPTTRSFSDASAYTDTDLGTFEESLVPVAPGLLLDNAIRKSISPKAYPDIYNKIVMSSRTPAVPINLADMTKALVKGWQEHGEWPPKAQPLEALAGKKRNVASPRMDSGAEPFLSHHPHLQKGVDSVKRILHLNVLGNLVKIIVVPPAEIGKSKWVRSNFKLTLVNGVPSEFLNTNTPGGVFSDSMSTFATAEILQIDENKSHLRIWESNPFLALLRAMEILEHAHCEALGK